MSLALKESGIETDTVHRFQGQEKDVVILTMADDEATGLSDDPHLLNMAVPRVKKKLCLMTSGNEQPLDSNPRDLISKYHNFAIVDGEIYFLFDPLYQPYTMQRIEFIWEQLSSLKEIPETEGALTTFPTWPCPEKKSKSLPWRRGLLFFIRLLQAAAVRGLLLK